jgi:hypothetical protein
MTNDTQPPGGPSSGDLCGECGSNLYGAEREPHAKTCSAFDDGSIVGPFICGATACGYFDAPDVPEDRALPGYCQKHAREALRECLAENFIGFGGSDWEINEDHDGYTRRCLLFDEANRGGFIGEAIISMARHYGFVPTADDAGCTHEIADDEFYCETWDEARDYLTELAGDNYFFEQDGDFFAIETRDLPRDMAVCPMPSSWASYLINGDASGLTAEEVQACDQYLNKNEIAEVIDQPGEAFFSWSYASYGGTAEGGDLAHYIVRHETPVRVWEGNYGVAIEFRNGDEELIGGSGAQDANVEALLRTPYIAAQFDMPFATINPESVRQELKEYGAWDETELTDETKNRARILWIAAGNLRDEEVSST